MRIYTDAELQEIGRNIGQIWGAELISHEMDGNDHLFMFSEYGEKFFVRRTSEELVRYLPKERNKALMEEIIKYCTLRDMFDNMILYANGHKYSSDFHPDAQVIVIPILDKDMVRVSFDDPSEAPTEAVYYDCGPCDVRDYLEYCNPDTVSMSFEGYFNSAYNGYYGSNQTEEDITDIAEQYGLYPEQGHSWNLAFYE